ncbi:MAG: hypothetical protein CVU41_12775 [Chloroflexi bacterium HGW-Chloroflexi-3]|nr:MAG: hypothetical protein CVU41_12775 [Chloroflexi bacterium HGW-Chloroflexi-3]
MHRRQAAFSFVIGVVIIFTLGCNILWQGVSTPTPLDQLSGDPTLRTVQIEPDPTISDQTVTIFLVGIEDKGISGIKIGCDDSLIPVEVTIRSDLTSPWSALSALLNLDVTYFGESGLYNALHQSDLEIQSYETHEGKAKVYLEGELMLGGVCDTPRVEEQILASILQDGQIEDVEVYINGVLLQEVLSLK